MGRAKRREVVDRVPTLQVPLHSSRLRAVVISMWTVRTTARIPCVCSRHLSWMGYGGSWCHKVEMETQSRSGWCSGYHARFTRERSRVQSSHPIFFFQQTEDRFIFSRRLFISVIYTWTKGNETTHCEYVATSEIISLCNSIVSLSAYARRSFKSHSVLYWESPRPLPSLSLRTWRNNALRTLLQFQKRLDRCHCILDRRFLLIDVCHHRIRRGSSQFRHLPSAQVDHFPKCVI